MHGRRRSDRRKLAVLTPDTKAASVPDHRGVPATTTHRNLHTAAQRPQPDKNSECLGGTDEQPAAERATEAALYRAAPCNARRVPDDIAAMTDRFALQHHERRTARAIRLGRPLRRFPAPGEPIPHLPHAIGRAARPSVYFEARGLRPGRVRARLPQSPITQADTPILASGGLPLSLPVSACGGLPL